MTFVSVQKAAHETV